MASKQIIFLIIVLAIGGLLGFFLGKSNLSGQKPSSVSSTPALAQLNPLFRSQTATFQGEIVKVNKDSLEVKSDSGKMGSLALSSKVVIYKFKEGSKQATASSDLSSIETGKKVLAILEFSGGEYKVVSISFQPFSSPVPTSTPLKKNNTM